MIKYKNILLEDKYDFGQDLYQVAYDIHQCAQSSENKTPVDKYFNPYDQSVQSIFNYLERIVKGMKGGSVNLNMKDIMREPCYKPFFDYVQRRFTEDNPQMVSGNKLKPVYRGMWSSKLSPWSFDIFKSYRLGDSMKTRAQAIQPTSKSPTVAIAFALGAMMYIGGSARENISKAAWPDSRIGLAIKVENVPLEDVIFYDGFIKSSFGDEQEITIKWPMNAVNKIVKGYVSPAGRPWRAVKDSSKTFGEVLEEMKGA